MSVDDVVFETAVIYFLGFLGVWQHRQGFVVFAEDVVNIDTHEDFYLGDVA